MARKKLPKKRHQNQKEVVGSATLGDMLQAKGENQVHETLKKRSQNAKVDHDRSNHQAPGTRRQKIDISRNKKKKSVSRYRQKSVLSDRQRQKIAEAEYKNRQETVPRVYHLVSDTTDPLSRKVDAIFRYTKRPAYKPGQTWTEKEPKKDHVEKLSKILKNRTLQTRPSQKKSHIDTESQIKLESFITSSREGFAPNENSNLTAAVIGFDFGTSSTKIVVQLPYEMGEVRGVGISAALPVPKYFRADNHPHLWTTVIWYSPKDGTFSLAPKKGFEQISDIKTQLMGLTSEASSNLLPGGLDHEIIATAYVALMLRVTIGWTINDAFKETTVEGYRWSVNMGIPAATLDDQSQKKSFSSVLNAGWLLASSENPVKLETVRSYLRKIPKDLHSFEGAALSLIPEIAAASFSYIKSNLASEGLYVMVDIGASTLDASVFKLDRNESGEWDYKIFTADVRLFGVFSLDWIQQIRVPRNDLLNACSIMLRRVVWRTRKKEDSGAKAWSTELPVLICGGGRDIEFYEDAVSSLDNLMKEHTKASGINVRNIPQPKSLKAHHKSMDYHRLTVAWGLSFEEFEYGDIITPSFLDDVEYNAPISHFGLPTISKDQV